MPVYEIDFVTDWGQDDFPALAPKDPHTGNMLLVVHDGSINLFEEGGLASPGIQHSAAYGNNDVLLYELRRSRAPDQAEIKMIDTAGVLHAPGRHRFLVHVDRQHPFVSFATMIAPSGDLFTGIGALRLQNPVTGEWISNAKIPLWAYDAGADTSTIFQTFPKHPTAQLQPIRKVVGPPLWSSTGGTSRTVPIAQLVFRRIA